MPFGCLWKAHIVDLVSAQLKYSQGKLRNAFKMIEWKLRLSVWLYFYRTRVRSLLFTNWLTDWLTHCCLVNLIDVTLACEDANSKLFDVVTVADVDDEDRVGNSLLQISKLRFGQKAKLLFRLWAQGLVKILMLKFRQDLRLASLILLIFCRGYEVESWSGFWS